MALLRAGKRPDSAAVQHAMRELDRACADARKASPRPLPAASLARLADILERCRGQALAVACWSVRMLRDASNLYGAQVVVDGGIIPRLATISSGSRSSAAIGEAMCPSWQALRALAGFVRIDTASVLCNQRRILVLLRDGLKVAAANSAGGGNGEDW